jgi:AcrR family transcriptional regulator
MPKASRRTKATKRARERARTPEAKAALRTRILREAVALFVEEGYRGFAMRKLATRLRYSAPTLYAYFANKDELLLAIIGEGYHLFRSYVLVAEGDPVRRFEAVGTAYMDFAFQNPTLYTLMFIHRPGPLFDLSEATVQARMGILHEVVRTAREAPAFAGADDAAVLHAVQIFWAVLHGLVSLALTIPLFDEAWARRNFEFLLHTLRPLLANAGAVRAARSA